MNKDDKYLLVGSVVGLVLLIIGFPMATMIVLLTMFIYTLIMRSDKEK